MDFDNLDFSQAKIAEPGTETTVNTPATEPETAATTEPAGTETAPATGETTPQETIAEPTQETTPATEPTTEPATEPETTQQESVEQIFSRTFKEKYGYDTVEEYLAAQKPEEKAPEYSETIKKLIDWEGKGLKPEEFFKTQTQDFEAMSDAERVKNAMALENPDWTPEDIDLMFEDMFKLDEEEYSEKEVRLAKLKLKEEAKKALPKLKDWQVKAATPEVDTAAQEQQAQAQAQAEAYFNQVDQQLRDFSAIDIALDDKGEKLTIPIADKKGLEAMVKDVNSFFSEFVAADATGKAQYKVKELAEALYFAKNRHKIAKDIAAQARSKGVAQVQKELNNASDTVQRETPAVDLNTPLARLGNLVSIGRL